MYTVKVENNDGEVSLYQGEEVRYKSVQVDSYKKLCNARQNFQEKAGNDICYTVDGNWPLNEDEFNGTRKDVKARYNNGTDKNCKDEDFSDTLINVGRVELIGGEKEYQNIVIFAAKVYIMNDAGQTVDSINLLR